MDVQVPFFELVTQYRELREEILESLDRVCRSASFVLGEEVELFEREFADYCGVAHCVALNSGTSALHLAVLAAGVQPGDSRNAAAPPEIRWRRQVKHLLCFSR